MIKSFLDLEIYQESLQLAKEIHFLLKEFPEDEKYLLVDQIKGASRSIPSLLAEGWAKRRQTKEFKKYLRGAIGECNEMMNHLKQSEIFGYLDEKSAKRLIERYDKIAAKIARLKTIWRNFVK